MSESLPRQEAEAYSNGGQNGTISGVNDGATITDTGDEGYGFGNGDRENDAATALQSRIRGRQASFKIDQMKEEKQQNVAATAVQSRIRGRQASLRVASMREQIEVDVLLAEAEVERDQAARERRRTRESEASMVQYEMEQILPALDNQLQQQELVMQQQLLLQQQVCAFACQRVGVGVCAGVGRARA